MDRYWNLSPKVKLKKDSRVRKDPSQSSQQYRNKLGKSNGSDLSCVWKVKKLQQSMWTVNWVDYLFSSGEQQTVMNMKEESHSQLFIIGMITLPRTGVFISKREDENSFILAAPKMELSSSK